MLNSAPFRFKTSYHRTTIVAIRLFEMTWLLTRLRLSGLLDLFATVIDSIAVLSEFWSADSTVTSTAFSLLGNALLFRF